jgi:hypothetical protein
MARECERARQRRHFVEKHECRQQAALHVKAVFLEQSDPETTEGEKWARLAAALDYQRRVEVTSVALLCALSANLVTHAAAWLG